MRVGILTGGGDCPGLNAVIRAVVIAGHVRYGYETLGYPRRLAGRARGPGPTPRPGRVPRACSPWAAPCSARRAPTPSPKTAGPSGWWQPGRPPASTRWWRSAATTRSAWPTSSARWGSSVVGVPKTIDNDLSGTEVTFGFQTAVQTATEAIDRLGTHGRVAPPGHRLRGDGSPRRVDRHRGRHRRRRRRDPRPRGPLRPRRGVRQADGPPRARPVLLDRRGGRGRAAGRPGARRVGHRAPRRAQRPTRSATPGWAGSATGWPASSSAGPATRPASTTLGHIQRGGTPDGLRPGARHPLRGGGGRGGPRRRLRGDGRAAGRRRSSASRCSDAVGNPKTVDRALLPEVAAPFLG